MSCTLKIWALYMPVCYTLKREKRLTVSRLGAQWNLEAWLRGFVSFPHLLHSHSLCPIGFTRKTGMGSCPQGVYSVVSSDSDSPSQPSWRRGLEEWAVFTRQLLVTSCNVHSVLMSLWLIHFCCMLFRCENWFVYSSTPADGFLGLPPRFFLSWVVLP